MNKQTHPLIKEKRRLWKTRIKRNINNKRRKRRIKINNNNDKRRRK